MAEHEIMKAKLDGFINPQRRSCKYDEKDTCYPARYARAIAYYQMKEPDKALKRVDALLADQPNNPYLWELKGQILFEFGRAKEAEAPQRRSVELKPDAPLLRVNLGQTLIALDDKTKVDEGIAELQEGPAPRKRTTPSPGGCWPRPTTSAARTAWPAWRPPNTTTTSATCARPGCSPCAPARGCRRTRPDWRRATDIVLVSKPSQDDLKDLAREGSIGQRPGPVRLRRTRRRPRLSGRHDLRPHDLLASAALAAASGPLRLPEGRRRRLRPAGARLSAGPPGGDPRGRRKLQRERAAGGRRRRRPTPSPSTAASWSATRATSWPIPTARSRWWSSSTTAAATASWPRPQVVKLIQQNPDVRFVFKEFPIFGEVSDTAAKIALTPPGQGQGRWSSTRA